MVWSRAQGGGTAQPYSLSHAPKPSPNEWYLMMLLALAERGLVSCPVDSSPKGGFGG